MESTSILEESLLDSALSQKEQVVALLNSIESGDRASLSYIDPNKFTQHNLSAADGVAGFEAMMESLSSWSEPARVNTLRVIEDEDYVVAHSEYNLFGEKVGFDIFRFEDGLIVEHWDNLQVRASTTNPSNHTMVDGAVDIEDYAKTEKNRVLIERFAEDILVGENYANIGDYFDGDNYIQHNPQIGDGLSSFGKAMEQMANDGVVMNFTTIHKVLCEGNFALLVSEGNFGPDPGVPTCYYDLFRIENSKIAEHWDVMESIIPVSQRKNQNGKFGFR